MEFVKFPIQCCPHMFFLCFLVLTKVLSPVLTPKQNLQNKISSITISNIGESESVLFYSLSISSFENPLGGPDSIDNFWSDSNNESILENEWIDISDIGTQYSFTNNVNAEQITLCISLGFKHFVLKSTGNSITSKPFLSNKFLALFI